MSSVAVGPLVVLPLPLAAFFLPPPPAAEPVVTSDTGADDSESEPASDRRAATAVARFCLVGRRGADDFFLFLLFLAGAASAASASAPFSRARLLLPAAASATASPSTLVPMLLAPAVPRDVPRGSCADAAAPALAVATPRPPGVLVPTPDRPRRREATMAWAELVLRAAGCSSVVLAAAPGAGFESTTAAATAAAVSSARAESSGDRLALGAAAGKALAIARAAAALPPEEGAEGAGTSEGGFCDTTSCAGLALTPSAASTTMGSSVGFLLLVLLFVSIVR
mmetsp:Transcript_14587/g.34940  ORF Transcript_14587/g.34940 Transcript_14587/m.34940 type:complete len:282 (+) Transcript_14587:4324-5169(+)